MRGPSGKTSTVGGLRAAQALFCRRASDRFVLAGAPKFYYIIPQGNLSSEKLYKIFSQRIPIFVQSDESKKVMVKGL